jgi:hypothetical protein
MKFTKQEYADLHLLYGETRRNSRPARLPYSERFPEGVLPSRCTFVKLHLLELRSPLSGVRGARYHIIKRAVAYLHIRESVVCSRSLLYSVLSCMSINVML